MPKTLVYSEPNVFVRQSGHSNGLGPLTAEEAKAIIGWEEELRDSSNGHSFGDDYVLKDLYGRKIRLNNNPSNRPFVRTLADRYCNEMLRDKWALNLETIVIDRYGDVQQGQHRLVGFILAEQERTMNPFRWGKKPLTLDCTLGYGASEKADTVNTYDLGKGRSLPDVMFRHEKFAKDTDEKQQKHISKILSGAIRLVWLRAGGRSVSFAPHFPHSEALEFYANHKDLLPRTLEIIDIDSKEDSTLGKLLSLSYAAGFHYMMSVAESVEKSLEFWTLFSTGASLSSGNPILSLRQVMTRKDAGSGSSRDEIMVMIVKAWLAWVKGDTLTPKQLAVKKRKEGDKLVVSEFPVIGGVDVPPPSTSQLSRYQRLILATLKGKELSYQQIGDITGLQTGQLSKALVAQTRQGTINEKSLEALDLVCVKRYPDADENLGPLMFSLTSNGAEVLKTGK